MGPTCPHTNQTKRQLLHLLSWSNLGLGIVAFILIVDSREVTGNEEE